MESDPKDNQRDNPDNKRETYYITTPIYYVNARPHLGHTYTTFVCDTMAAYQKMRGKEVFFLTGTDEHGDKIVQAAEKEGKTPSEYVDEIAYAFRNTWNELSIDHHDFIRTTEARHGKVVREVLQKLYEQEDIYLDEYEGLYCYGCERYLTDKELTEDGLCPDHQKPPEVIKEKNYFFKLQKYLPLWLEELQKNPVVEPQRYYNEVTSTIQELIKLGDDLSISRPKSRLTWGIELPFDEGYVTYVWFDALLNYISALGGGESDNFRKFWPEVRHVIAKDILKPHAIYWPTMLMAASIPVYKRLFVHGYWLGMGDMKMSKSMGNALDPITLVEKIGNDPFRYFLMSDMNFGSDSRFSEEALQTRINQDLANGLGNLIQRTLSMNKKYFEGKIDPDVAAHEIEEQIEGVVGQIQGEYFQRFEDFQFNKAIESAFVLIDLLNKIIEDEKPWAMAKENSEKLGPLLHSLIKGIVIAAEYMKPFLPHSMKELLGILQPGSSDHFPASVGEIKLPEMVLTEWPLFFPRLDLSPSK